MIDPKKVRIGLVGSVAYETNFEEMSALLHELDKREDVQLVLLGLPIQDETTARVVVPAHKKDYDFWSSFKNLEWTPLVDMKDYFDTLNDLRLDLMLIPRSDRYFNRCKSNLKFLEASMLEIPVIAQGFTTGDSPYQGAEDSKYMEIVIDNTKWKEPIDKLVKDKELRREIGRKAREYVIENYAISKHIDKWINAYARLLEN